jgi:hypothetical protein
VLAPAAVTDYRVGDSASAWTTGRNVIVHLSRDDEDGDEWDVNGHGLPASIIPVRAVLAAGDLRLLYLGDGPQSFLPARVRHRVLRDGRPWPWPGGVVGGSTWINGSSRRMMRVGRGSHLGTPSARDRRGGSTAWLPGAMLVIWSSPCS